MEMTAPVLMENKVMRFILPFKYKTIDQIPVPKDQSISIKHVPAHIVGVYRFSGIVSDERSLKKLQKLYRFLYSDHLLPSSEPRLTSEVILSEKGDGAPGMEARPVLKNAPAEKGPAEPTAPAPAIPPMEGVPGGIRWSVAQYNPPYTLPFLRRNEIWVELSEDTPAVAALVQNHAAGVKVDAGEKEEGSVDKDLVGKEEKVSGEEAQQRSGSGPVYMAGTV
jgi:hypothetical protein